MFLSTYKINDTDKQSQQSETDNDPRRMKVAKAVRFEDLLGKTLVKIDLAKANDEIIFTADDGSSYALYHSQDCCEFVEIEDIEGDFNDLLGSPITVAAEVSQVDPVASESGTWTFYKMATVKGWVDVRWYGSSNGYYSESVDFRQVTKAAVQ